MPHNQTVIDALCQVVSRHLPPPLQSVLDALMDRLQEQRIHAGSNKDEQTYIDFFRVCKHLREAVHLDTAAGICQRLRHSAPLSAAPTDLSEWNLVDDAEVEAMLDTRRLARGLREPLGNLEWRVCNCLGQLDSSLKKDSDNPLSLEFLLHTLQASLRLHEQPAAIRELFYRCCIEVLGRGLQDTWMKSLFTLRLSRAAPHWPWPTAHTAGLGAHRPRPTRLTAVTRRSSS